MDFLDRIEQAENEGEKLVTKAEQDSDELIRTARFEARKLTETVGEECRQIELRMIAEGEAAAHERSNEAKKESQKILESLCESARGNMDRTVRLIVDHISGTSNGRKQGQKT